MQQNLRHATATKTTAPCGKNWSPGLLMLQELLWKLSDVCKEGAREKGKVNV